MTSNNTTSSALPEFESGAKTAAANNLVLSVMNDGRVYEDRKHIGFAMLQGSTHLGLTFRDLANNEANTQRAMGCKFKAAEITDAGQVIQEQTLASCIEQIRDEWNGENIQLYGRTWFDRINGNTYFSARVVIPTAHGVHWVAVPFQYGYGDQWVFECRHVLERMGFEDMATGYVSDKPVQYFFEGEMRKRDMFRGVTI